MSTGRNFVSNEMAGRIRQSISYTENIGSQMRPEKRRIHRNRGGGGTANFALCTITGERGNNEYNVDVKVGNPNAQTEGAQPKGILYLNYGTTNGVAVGGQLMAIFYKSESSEVEYDCFPIETLMNLVAPPDNNE